MHLPRLARQLEVGTSPLTVAAAVGTRRDAVTGSGDASGDAERRQRARRGARRFDRRGAGPSRLPTGARRHLGEIFGITCQLSLFPPAARFTELQKQLADAIEAEAEFLAVRPVRAIAAID